MTQGTIFPHPRCGWEGNPTRYNRFQHTLTQARTRSLSTGARDAFLACTSRLFRLLKERKVHNCLCFLDVATECTAGVGTWARFSSINWLIWFIYPTSSDEATLGSLPSILIPRSSGWQYMFLQILPSQSVVKSLALAYIHLSEMQTGEGKS